MANFSDEPIPPRLTPPPEQMREGHHLSFDEPPPEALNIRRSTYYTPNNPADPSSGKGGWRVKVHPYDPQWAQQFQSISTHLQRIFHNAATPAHYTAIEHIGSTSVPNLPAKPNIDVLVTFPNDASLTRGVDALLWEIPSHPPFVRYTQIANGGGIQGRESFKLYLPSFSPYYASTPEQSVYLIDESAANHEGRVQIRSYRSLRDTLLDPANADLLREYAQEKLRLAEQTFEHSITYSMRKDVVVRKILKRAGWTDDEVDEKERLSMREVVERDEEFPY